MVLYKLEKCRWFPNCRLLFFFGTFHFSLMRTFQTGSEWHTMNVHPFQIFLKRQKAKEKIFRSGFATNSPLWHVTHQLLKLSPQFVRINAKVEVEKTGSRKCTFGVSHTVAEIYIVTTGVVDIGGRPVTLHYQNYLCGTRVARIHGQSSHFSLATYFHLFTSFIDRFQINQQAAQWNILKKADWNRRSYVVVNFGESVMQQ